MIKAGDKVVYKTAWGGTTAVDWPCTVRRVLAADEVHALTRRFGAPGEQYFAELEADDGSHIVIVPVSMISVVTINE